MTRFHFALTGLLACFALPAFAQDMPQIPPEAMRQIEQMQSMSPAQQQEMTERMNASADAMQRCVEDAKLDEAFHQEIETRTNALEKEVEGLCAKGDWQTATRKVKAFGDEIRNDTRIQKVQECAQLMAGFLPPEMLDFEQHLYKGDNVCADMERDNAQE